MQDRKFIISQTLGRRMVEAGILPKNCRNFQIVADVNEALCLRMDVLLAASDLKKLSEILADISGAESPVEQVVKVVEVQ